MAAMTRDEAREALASVVERVCGSFVPEDGPSMWRCPSGEPYVTLTSGGIKSEGEPISGKQADVAAAIAAYEGELKAYAAGKSGKLWWRVRPRVEAVPVGFYVYSRLIITDQAGARAGRVPVNP